jgi:hypothetical protein
LQNSTCKQPQWFGWQTLSHFWQTCPPVIDHGFVKSVHADL